MGSMTAEGTAGDATALRLVALTDDAAFATLLDQTFGQRPGIALMRLAGGLAAAANAREIDAAAVVVADLADGSEATLTQLAALAARLGAVPPIVAVVDRFTPDIARALMQVRVADMLAKPVPPVELVRACARVARLAAAAPAAAAPAGEEAQIFSLLPAAGGVGQTTLAIETAMLLKASGRKGGTGTCLVDLDFQHGACADYLDIEPRLDLKEIEPRPDRLDRQLLEVMLARHSSGLAVVAAPNRPAEMRSFDPDMVTRLLDLVSAHFEHVVIDMPRTWFAWTDDVLRGSNRVFVVTEMTIPGLRHARQLVDAIRERLDGGPSVEVVVNRFESRMFEAGLKLSDIEAALGNSLGATVPNNYRLVREAIDRGIPLEEVKAGNNVSAALKKLIFDAALPKIDSPPLAAGMGGLREKLLAWTRG